MLIKKEAFYYPKAYVQSLKNDTTIYFKKKSTFIFLIDTDGYGSQTLKIDFRHWKNCKGNKKDWERTGELKSKMGNGKYQKSQENLKYFQCM